MRRYAVLLAAVVLLAACGGNDDAQPSAEPSEADAKTTNIQVTLVTTSGTVGQNHDDELCVWGEPSYVLRDGKGVIVATGEPSMDARLGGRPAAVGQIVSLDPEYRCELSFAISAAPAEFYQLTVAIQTALDGEHISEATFPAENPYVELVVD